jgi:hypothetical protein
MLFRSPVPINTCCHQKYYIISLDSIPYVCSFYPRHFLNLRFPKVNKTIAIKSLYWDNAPDGFTHF